MRIAVLAIGSRGDVQPYVSLGAGLRDAGHDVWLATPPGFERLVDAAGLSQRVVVAYPKEVIEAALAEVWEQLPRRPDRFVRLLRSLIGSGLRAYWLDFLTACARACEGAELILYSQLGFAGFHAGEAQGVPAYAALTAPLTRTRAFPHLAFAAFQRSFGARLNYLTHLLGEQLFWLPMRGPINRWRGQELNLPPVPRSGIYPLIDRTGMPTLYGFSSLLLPRPPDWPPACHMTGYWQHDGQSAGEPPSTISEFVERGPAPVLVTLGSIRPSDAAERHRTILQAIRRARMRAIVIDTWQSSDLETAEGLLVVSEAPLRWVLERAAVAVHHAGAATTGDVLAAGVPSVTVPFFGDQFFWAQRLAASGVAARPIRPAQLNSDALEAALVLARSDSMRDRARSLGAALRAENGVERAVRLIEAAALSFRPRTL